MDNLQAQVLSILLTKAGWVGFSSLVEGDVINNTEVRTLYEHIQKLHDQSANDLSPELLALDLESAYPEGDRRAELLEMVEYIAECEEVEPSALKGLVQRYVSGALLAKASKYIAQNLGSGSLDADVALALVQRAVDVVEGAAGGIVDLADAGLSGTTDPRAAVVSLGLSDQLDASLDGGLAAGELGVLLAPPSRGKTSLLCLSGARAAQAGRGVLHITLEVSTGKVIRRYDQALTAMTVPEMRESPKTVMNARRKYVEAGGQVHIINWSYKDVTPNDVRGLIKQTRAEGKKVDLVIIDYLELMEPNRSTNMARREQRHAYGALGKQIRAVACGQEVPIMTAWQVNREGSDSHNVELRHISECWDIIKHADAIIALQQTDAERDDKVMRLRLLKQRESTARPHLYLHSDLDRMILRATTRGGGVIAENQTLDATAEVG